MKFFNLKADPADPTLTQSVETILPYAGETMDGGVREADPQRLRDQLLASAMHRQLLERAARFAAQQDWAEASEQGEERFAQGIRQAGEDYLNLFRRKEIERGGFALGVARLLQYFMGLNSITDAVIRPVNRSSFGVARAARG